VRVKSWHNFANCEAGLVIGAIVNELNEVLAVTALARSGLLVLFVVMRQEEQALGQYQSRIRWGILTRLHGLDGGACRR
jgi:hypothetical protein